MIKVGLPQFTSLLSFSLTDCPLKFILIHLPSEWVHKILDNIVFLGVSYHQIRTSKYLRANDEVEHEMLRCSADHFPTKLESLYSYRNSQAGHDSHSSFHSQSHSQSPQ